MIALLRKIDIDMKFWILSLVLISFIAAGAFGQTKETGPEYLLRFHGPWKTYESKNFKLYYRVNPKDAENLTDSELASIASAQQLNLYRIGDILSIPHYRLDTLRKMNVWLFKDLKEKTSITRISANAFAIRPFWSFYYTYEVAEGAHELGHLVIQEFWGYFNSKKYQFVIEEGYASLVDEGHGFRDYNYFEESKKIIRRKKYSMANIINNANIKGVFKNPYTQKAIVAGGFVKYLIREYGIDRFKELWLTLTDDGKAFESVYNRTMDELATDYTDFLNSY